MKAVADKSGRHMENDIFNLPVRKKTINQKQKGNTNERECAKALGTWVGTEFGRVAGSGSTHWVNNHMVTSDVVCKDIDFKFPAIVETKHLAKISIQKNLRKNSEIFTIWEQVITDAARANKLPMLMLRENGMKAFSVDGNKVCNYYIVFDSRYGGTFFSVNIPILFKGKCDKFDSTLMGFWFSDIVQNVEFTSFAFFVKNKNILSNFITYAKGFFGNI